MNLRNEDEEDDWCCGDDKDGGKRHGGLPGLPVSGVDKTRLTEAGVAG